MELPPAKDVEAVQLIQGKILVCRLCHKECESSELINGHDTHIIETESSTNNVTLFGILRRTTNLTFETDALPHQFCSECCQELLSHYLFSLKCLEKEVLLLNLINSLSHHTLDSIKINSKPDVEKSSYYLLAFNPKEESTKRKTVKCEIKSKPEVECETGDKIEIVLDPMNESIKGELEDAELPLKGGPCEFCGKVLSSRKSLRLHRIICKNRDKNVIPDMEFNCDLCNASFLLKSRLRFHIKTVHIAPTIPCKLCEKLFKTKRSLNRHLIFHSDERKHKCRFCEKKFKRPHDLACHERIHTGTKPYPCSECDLRFLSACRRKSHFLNKHCKKSDVCNFACKLCDSTFHSKGLLLAHNRSVHIELSVACEICGKLFKTLGQLKEHLSVHSDDKKYKCSTCNNSFKTSKGLFYHKRIHTGEKPFPCSKCDLSFSASSARTAHFLSKHCERSVACKICFSKFPSNSRVNQHMKRVHFKGLNEVKLSAALSTIKNEQKKKESFIQVSG